ncbi:M13 family metallopeptidase [Aestuariibaculum suncheonense]|uniref:M13 family metallopeptidase n=1 Tax=Aestuariibaculum suncheonense TaxID=1028745 RepID=A0A8J6QBL1_9FLAO|nr:M13 family metallopeptidase [Aestuariibaculum suncheonense]MBD0836575.1 M13 family metallopeptidase [Aestuariibaculum suncheonense]
MKTNLNLRPFLGLSLVLAISSCKNEAKNDTTQVAQTPGINLEFMDPSVKPQNDFFKFVNGKWLETTQIPDDQTRWGSFNELRKKTDEDALAILKHAMSDNKDIKKSEVLPGSDQQKAIDLYKSIIDTISRNKLGINPIKADLKKIEAIQNIDDLEAFLIEKEPTGGIGFFGFFVGTNPKNSNINSAYLGSGSLGLPDRDYYVKDDTDSKDKRAQYVAHITKMLQYLGDTEAEASAQAKRILAFETRLAEPKMDKVERRDARKRYNPKSIAELQNMVPAINWNTYFKGIGVKSIDTIIVSELKYTEALQNILAENNVDDWKAYLRWSLFNRSAGTLSTEIENANFEFYGKTLRGAKQQRPLEERALLTVNSTVGEALGKLYVDEVFPAEAKARAEKMIANVIKAFENRIRNASWMTEETKEKAVEKLLALNVKIAYPDKWKDYSDLEIHSTDENGSFSQNMQNVSAWSHKKNLEDLGQPVDKSRWGMSPQTVNAYFNPSFNEIVFPAAILQPPFFNFHADDAVNYGGIGAVIGHEISHCFDDSGARYDKNGNLNNWWTDEDLKQFEALGKDLADQYSAIQVLPETNINGPFTLGENIGDLGGVNAAYDALQLSFKDNGRPEDIDGFTAEQRFFMSWATVWRTKMRDDALKNQIKTDPHSPGMTRAVQPLLNIDAFYEAFNIKDTDSLYLEPSKRVKIW